MLRQEGNPCEVDALYSLPGRSRPPLSYTLIKAEWHQNEKFHLSFGLKEGTEDKNIIILLYVSEEKADVKRLAVQQFPGQPLATYRDNEYSGFSCSSVIFISKALFAFMSSYQLYDLHLFTHCYWRRVFYVILSKWPKQQGPALEPMQTKEQIFFFTLLQSFKDQMQN